MLLDLLNIRLDLLNGIGATKHVDKYTINKIVGTY